ncbi:hypothetical protein CEY12_12740 [Chryseobacterium sp. T16E-39]|uniref:hypothetical protein n=1 Tax=Chryseobacterium sp. T16E-39 TaxID=2015076 RepID=UPI000B5B1420|nr:hypothetical protein [Chryseobacterium sp. T16E-39]ASK30915.1 hypothetical protein CEY12_12740 [Chryseobacterium sp. T16E-39]
MLKIFDEKMNGFLFTIILPLLLFSMAYYGFESSYTRLKTAERPPDYLFSSVYAYRVIPNYLSLYLTGVVGFVIDNYLGFFQKFLFKNGTAFYHGLFLMNSFFFILSSIILNKILRLKPVELLLNTNVRGIVHLLAIFFIVITQYAPTNCDMMALFCYLTGVFLTLKYLYTNRSVYFYSLIGLIFLSTFIRETACLNIAFFAAIFLNIDELKKRDFRFIWKTIPLVVAFLVAYLGLRMIIVQETTFVEGFYINRNFESPFNLAGLLFGCTVLYFVYQLCGSAENKTFFKKYLFFSLPYLVMITMVGLYWEVRLFLPLILTGIIVAYHQFKNSVIRP